VGLLVAPDAWEARSILERADGVLPVPPGAVGVAFEHVSTWETDDGWAEIKEDLSEIWTQTILTALKRRWEERNEVEV
jgi:hypothetical protein